MRRYHAQKYLWLALLCWLSWFAQSHAADYQRQWRNHLRKQKHQTRVGFTADLVILGRSGLDSNSLLFTDDTLTTPLLDASELTFVDLPTGRYDIVLSDNSPYELQFSLFGFPTTAEARAQRSSTDIVALYYGTASPPASVVGSDTFGVVYDTDFGSGEVNLRRRLGENVTLLAGFRIFTLQEDLLFVALEELSGDTLTSTGLFSNVDNTLYGFQLGAESILWTAEHFRFVVVGKGGIYGNHLEVNALMSDPVDPLIDRALAQEDDLASFAGELQLTLEIPIAGGSLRLGYQLYGISHAAFATDQLDDFDVLTNTGSFDVRQIVYQGGFVGLNVPF